MKKGYTVAALRIIIWVLIIGWMSIVACDFLRAKKSKDPIFCIKNDVITEEDGNTYICTGLGYKYYSTVKESYVMKKFVPFWADEEEVGNHE